MAYTDDAVKAKLSALNETQEGIVTVAQGVMFHRLFTSCYIARDVLTNCLTDDMPNEPHNSGSRSYATLRLPNDSI